VRTRSRACVRGFSLLRSSQCRCLRSLSPRPKHPVVSPSPFSRRLQSIFQLAAAAHAQTAPCARANRTSPRSCCVRRSKVRTADIHVESGDTGSAFVASLPARCFQSRGAPRASRPSAASKVNVLTASSFSLFPLQHSWHEASARAFSVPSFISFMCECFRRFTRAGVDALRRCADGCTGNLLREHVHPVGLAQLSQLASSSRSRATH
jgi:hypothetical protein